MVATAGAGTACATRTPIRAFGRRSANAAHDGLVGTLKQGLGVARPVQHLSIT
jgi:hypothetical protein